MKISNAYRQPLVNAGVASAILMVLGALIVDFGETLRLILISMLVFWAWIGVAVYRRPENPTTTDLTLIRLGVVPFVICFVVIQFKVWQMRGLGY